jgi:nucleoid-associated protein YgaU
MINRYADREIFKNDLEQYKDTLKDRNLKFIRHYSTAKFTYPKSEQLKYFQTIQYTWKLGDKFSKLADIHYGDAKDWWIIAKYNQKPTESHVQVGDTIEIPYPLSSVIKYLLG